ncbi:MAG: alpha-galactosidase [Deltaproteobacteria bacterium]|nr:alpha-galactosidase [Deltaproteobacteria bacterium]
MTLTVACSPPAPITFGDDIVEVTLRRADGAIDLRDKATGVEVQNLHFAVDAVVADGARLFTSLGRTMSCKVDTEKDKDAGVVTHSEATCDADTGSGVKVQARLVLDAAAPGVLRWETDFENRSGKDVTLRRIYPFRAARSEEGSFLVGDDPAKVRVLQNGSDELVDFYVAVYPGSTALTDRNQPAIVRDPSTYSNGSALAHDLASGASFLAGFLAFDWATPQIAMAGDPAGAAPVNGRVPMTEMWAEARFPWDVAAPQGKRVSGGTAVMILGTKSPHAALETYAEQVKAEKSITLPPLPYSGWDSWYLGPGKPDLSEGWVRTAADSLAASFQRYGLSSMQLDEGWQDAWGDWNAGDTFPSGMTASADHIKAVGLKPELWIAPFDAALGSQLATAHPEWLLEKNSFGAALIPADKRALDIGRDEVVDHVRDLGSRIKGWGFESVKMDFAYYALLSEMPVNLDVTNTTAYRAAVKAFREALGPDIYLINISMCFPNYGLVDAFRVGLDDWPCWDAGECRGESHGQGGISGQGLKPALRMAARRYWMNGRIWWNHHDQVFFRDLIGEEAQAWISAAALSGGMLSLGEDPTTLTAEQIEIYRRVLPLQGLTARPMDLLTREYPEVWDLATDAGGDAGGSAHVVGLFNWGTNRDLGASPPVDMPEAARTVSLDLDAVGLDPAADYLAYEFWTNTYVGTVRGTLSAELQPRAVRVYRLVAKPVDAPTYLATNRHVLMGAGIVDEPMWTADTGTLVAHIHTTLAHLTDLFFYVPDGYTVTNVDMDGVLDLAPEMTPDGLLRVRFTGLDGGLHPVVITVARN